MKLPAVADKANRLAVKAAPLPVPYLRAIELLQECQTIDDIRYWSNYSEAMCAWAKINKNREVEIESKKLKLHAYRQMGICAQLQSAARPKSAKKWLRKVGMSTHSAAAALHLARMDKPKWDETVKKGHSPIQTVDRSSRTPWSDIRKCLGNAQVVMRQQSASTLARDLLSRVARGGQGISHRMIQNAADAADFHIAWLTEFRKALKGAVK